MGLNLDQRTLTPPSPTTLAQKHSLLSPKRYPVFESLQYRDFRWMVAGSFVSFLAMNMQMITRGWLILRLADDSPLALTLVMMSFSLPMTFVSLVGGALADRMPRKRMVIISQSATAVMTVVVGTLDYTGIITFWHLMVIGFINGSLIAFNMPSRQAILSEIVPEKSLMNAISLNNSGMNLTRIVGPAAAGFLILAIETSGVFFVVSGIYVFSIITTMMIDAGKTPASSSRNGVAGDIGEGLRYAASDPGRRGLIAIVLMTSLFGFSYWILMPAWAREALDVGPEDLGILLTIMGVGAVIGTLGLAMVSNVGRRGLLVIGSSLLWGVSLAVFSQLTSYALTVPLLLIIGAISAVSMSITMTMLQTLAAPEMRGRMMSIAMMTFGLTPLSAVPFGLIAERAGTPDALLLSGAILVVTTLIFAAVQPTFRRID